MSMIPLTPEPFDALSIRRRTARSVLGWSDAETNSSAEDHAAVCRVLEESDFIPEPEITSAAGVLCGTGIVSISLSKELAEALAKAELDHFASRYFFYESERRTEIWLQLTPTVAPYPALAWRHLHLLAGLKVARDVLRPLGENVELAAALIQWYIESPRVAANDVRKYVLQAVENSRTADEFWTEWFEVQLKASPVSVLTPPGVAAIQSRMHWVNTSGLIPNDELIIEAPVQGKPSRARRIPKRDLKKAFLILFATFILLPQFMRVFVGGGFSSSRSDRSRPAQTMNSAPLPVMPRPTIIDVPVSQNFTDRDTVRGAKVIDLLHYIGTVRRIANNSKHPAIVYASAGISQRAKEVQDLKSVHALADSVNRRSDQTTDDVALILPESLSEFYCVGFGRIDDQQRIHSAFWEQRKKVLDRFNANKMVQSLSGKKPLDVNGRRALQEELESLTEMKVLVLTPDEFLATFDSPSQIDADTVKSELDSVDLMPPVPAVPQD